MPELLPAQRSAPLHAYIHIPYCLKKCAYCDFCSYPLAEAALTPSLYENLILREAALILDRAAASSGGLLPLETVYFGGGTPTAVPVTLICRMLELLHKRTGIRSDAEITVEMNPGTLDRLKLETLKEAGVNRLSIGLQSASDRFLEKLGRAHRREDFDRSFAAARALGFQNINVDLMLALPGQTLSDAERDLAYLLSPVFSPEHISVYSLIIEEGTPFGAIYREGVYPLPDEETERVMYHMVRERLRAEGYVPYEISNHAKPGFESRHNLAYWDGESYYGFGAGASSYLFGERKTNTGDLLKYKAYVEAGAEAEADEFIDAAEAVREFFIFRLRKAEGFSEAEFRALFGRGFSPEEKKILRLYEERGLLREAGGRWAYTREGLDYSDEVARAFI